ncbi:MAG: hypothetical protein KBA67_04095 [Leptotrichiaceae bacterium]|nr:hypothetical protein [Leptotrichiaceae bacterium]
MSKKKEKIYKFSDFKEVENILEFILKYRNTFEKRKYFIIDEDYKIIKREPSFILELAYIYYETKIENEAIKKIIKENFEDNFIDKDKKIERLSKIKEEKLIDSFRRSILNNDSIHSVKLGNELLHRNKKEFFKILYNISLISIDENKLIKTYFTEKIIEKIEKIENNSFNKNRLQIDEVVKNIINYFTESETGYLNFEDNERIEYFSKSRVSILYKKIYEENYEKIVNKYSILSTKKIKFENVLNEDYNELSEVKKELYDYL